MTLFNNLGFIDLRQLLINTYHGIHHRKSDKNGEGVKPAVT